MFPAVPATPQRHACRRVRQNEAKTGEACGLNLLAARVEHLLALIRGDPPRARDGTLTLRKHSLVDVRAVAGFTGGFTGGHGVPH
jgi:hypothetical protein